MSKLKEILEKTLTSIDSDRTDAKQMFDDIASHIGKSADKYATLGLTAAKFLETLQKSNEQRVKLLSIFSSRLEDEDDFGEVSKEEADAIYEQFEEEENEVVVEPIEEIKDGS
jgi:hypothetical protein